VSCNFEILDRPQFGHLEPKPYQIGTIADSYASIALELMLSLQASLDPEDLIARFANVLQQHGAVRGIRFHEPDGTTLPMFGNGNGYCSTFVLRAADLEVGELSIYTPAPLSTGERTLFETLVGCLAFPLHNALQHQRALQSAMSDSLTGLGNRAAFDAHIAREFSLAQRHGNPLSLIIFDVDHFKLINDTWGHQSGDATLQSLAKCAKAAVRDGDLVFRFAGDEFAIVLPHASESDARNVAERVLRRVAKLDADAPHAAMSISLGVAGVTPQMRATDLFAAADRALYRAKKQGRGRVAVVSPEPSRVAV